MEIEISEDGFINMLNSQNGGAVVDELNREMCKGIGAILDHGGSSTVTVKFTFKKISGMDSGISISHDVIAKHPKEDRPNKAMFISTGNGLLDQPQEQQILPLGEKTEPVQSKLGDTTDNITHLNK